MSSWDWKIPGLIYNLVDVIEENCRMKQALFLRQKISCLFLLTFAQVAGQVVVSRGRWQMY